MLTLNKVEADVRMKPVAFWTFQLPADASHQFTDQGQKPVESCFSDNSDIISQ